MLPDAPLEKHRKAIALIATITDPKGFASQLTPIQRLVARHYLGLGNSCPKTGRVVAQKLYRRSDKRALSLVGQHGGFVSVKARIWLNHGETWPERLKARRVKTSHQQPNFSQAFSVCEVEDPIGAEAYRRVFGLNRTRQTTTAVAEALGYSNRNLVNHAVRRLSERLAYLLRNPRTLEAQAKLSEVRIQPSGHSAVRLKLMAVPDLEACFDLYRNQSQVQQLKYCYGLPPYRKPHSYSQAASHFGTSEAALKNSLFRVKEFVFSQRCRDQLPPQINVTTVRAPSSDQLVIPRSLLWQLLDQVGHEHFTSKLVDLAVRLSGTGGLIKREQLVRRFTASSGSGKPYVETKVEKLINWGIFASLNHGLYLRLTIDLNHPAKRRPQHNR